MVYDESNGHVILKGQGHDIDTYSLMGPMSRKQLEMLLNR